MTEEQIDIIIRTLTSSLPDMNYTVAFDLGNQMLAVAVCAKHKDTIYMVTDQSSRMRIRAEHSNRIQAYANHLTQVVTELYKELAEQIILEGSHNE